jgi:hypothetical protein
MALLAVGGFFLLQDGSDVFREWLPAACARLGVGVPAGSPTVVIVATATRMGRAVHRDTSLAGTGRVRTGLFPGRARHTEPRKDRCQRGSVAARQGGNA